MEKAEKMKELRIFAQEIRIETLKIIHSLGKGHVGGSMDLADLMSVLYGSVMNVDPKNPRWPDRDWCVLSKGHAGPVAYATLGLKGFYPIEDAYTLNQPGTRFPSHTDRNQTPGVDLTTGSLGQGFSEAVGAALGNRIDGRNNRVFVVVGDGESDEGQVWEAAEFAAHYKLDHLMCFVDNNGRQLDGAVADVMSQGKGLAAKFDAFGWNVIEVKDGNNVEQIYDAVQEGLKVTGKPTCVVLDTLKGKGAPFAESTGAHSSEPKPEQWDEAFAYADKQLAEIKAGN